MVDKDITMQIALALERSVTYKQQNKPNWYHESRSTWSNAAKKRSTVEVKSIFECWRDTSEDEKLSQQRLVKKRNEIYPSRPRLHQLYQILECSKTSIQTFHCTLIPWTTILPWTNFVLDPTHDWGFLLKDGQGGTTARSVIAVPARQIHIVRCISFCDRPTTSPMNWPGQQCPVLASKLTVKAINIIVDIHSVTLCPVKSYLNLALSQRTSEIFWLTIWPSATSWICLMISSMIAA